MAHRKIRYIKKSKSINWDLDVHAMYLLRSELWFLTVKQEQNLEKERIASLILDVDEALTKVKSTTYTIGQKVRYLRGIIRQVIEDGQTILPSLPKTPSPSELLGDFAEIPAGRFMMGSHSNEANRDSDESWHSVSLSKDFQMMKTEVTQKMWVDVMQSNPSWYITHRGRVGICSPFTRVWMVSPTNGYTSHF